MNNHLKVLYKFSSRLSPTIAAIAIDIIVNLLTLSFSNTISAFKSSLSTITSFDDEGSGINFSDPTFCSSN